MNVVKYLQDCTDDGNISQQINEANNKVEELESHIRELESREVMHEHQNKKLKDQNILLINQIQ